MFAAIVVFRTLTLHLGLRNISSNHIPTNKCINESCINVRWICQFNLAHETEEVTGKKLKKDNRPSVYGGKDFWKRCVLSQGWKRGACIRMKFNCKPTMNNNRGAVDYDTIRDAILTCARKPTWVSLIYRTEPTTKKCKTERLKSKNGYDQK